MSIRFSGGLGLGLALWAATGSAAFAAEWRFVGFDEAGRYAFYDREESRAEGGCRESARAVFRTNDGGLEVTVPMRRSADDPKRCFPDRDLISAEREGRILAKLASLYGAPGAIVSLAVEGGAFVGRGFRVELETRLQLPERDCARVDDAMRGRAYLRFRIAEGDRVRSLGRLVEFGPLSRGVTPERRTCWPDLAPDSGAESRDGKRLALLIGGIPVVLTRP
ncbi:MAG: hypothetical protein ACR2PQ_07420 [Myxococcota bacterium]